MAMVTVPAQVSISRRLASWSHTLSFQRPPIQRPRKLSAVKCAFSGPHPALQPIQSRRLASLSLLLSYNFILVDYATAGSLLDKYVKRKKLDPLDSYVPAVILTLQQFKDLEKFLESEKPEFAGCRTLLRYGPAASLRVNIRAVAQYASDSGNGKAAFNEVDQCLSALEELDSLLLHASRNEPGTSVKSMKAKIEVALNALDGLLQTVPQDVLDKGQAIADAYRIPDETEPEPDVSDPEIKQLESIL